MCFLLRKRALAVQKRVKQNCGSFTAHLLSLDFHQDWDAYERLIVFDNPKTIYMCWKMLIYLLCVCVCARWPSALHILPWRIARHGTRAAERSRLMTQRSTSHKHTYLASCHHVGEFGMLVDCQAQNVVAVFCIETLAGCKETNPHAGWNTGSVLLISGISHKK